MGGVASAVAVPLISTVSGWLMSKLGSGAATAPAAPAPIAPDVLARYEERQKELERQMEAEAEARRKEREETQRQLDEAEKRLAQERLELQRQAAEASEAQQRAVEAAMAKAAEAEAELAAKRAAEEAERRAAEEAERLAKLSIRDRANDLRHRAEAKLGMDATNKFNIGFCGETGTGKSSLINALRGVSDKQAEAAKVGETETTMEIRPFPHPQAKNIVLWDIPGGGTVKHPGAEYFWDKMLFAFDQLIVVGANRFKEFELELAKTAHAAKVPVVFVRTKMDADIINRADREEVPRSQVKDALREEVAAKAAAQLSEQGLGSLRFFAISARVLRGHANYPDVDFALDERELVEHVSNSLKTRRGFKA